MFWQQNVDQESKQKNPPSPASPSRRFNISFNVKIAVNVNTRMCNSHLNQQAASSCENGVQPRPRTFDLRQKLTRLGRQLTSGQDGHGGISTILIINLLFLILLSMCCDVCRSHDGRAFNYTAPRSPEPFKDLKQMGLLRPKLDSDVVEKVAIWHKHAAADPPSIVEGIAISSPAAVPSDLVSPIREVPEMETETETAPQHGQDQEQSVDERVVLERVTRDCFQRCIVEVSL